MNPARRYLLRRERLLKVWKAYKARERLDQVSDKTDKIRPDDILAFSTVRNERVRLAYFLHYYREIGVRHFFFVDNGSTDGTREYLASQPDCSVWGTEESYKRAKYGATWLNGLKRKYALGHWALVVDVDEFLVYPHIDARPLGALTDWLDASHIRSFGTLLLDMYSRDPVHDAAYVEGADPFETLQYFDSGNYVMSRNPRYGNLWIQGGVRQRVFFPDWPSHGPALNKIPLVRWAKGQVYVSSTHNLLPRGLNEVYDATGGERISGCLLHAKFLDLFVDKAREEAERGEHYAQGREYEVYRDILAEKRALWTPHSQRYESWRQLEALGLMSAGNWA